MSEQLQYEIHNLIPDNYADYGGYINFERVIPFEDGLKKVHRRALLGIRQVASGKFTSTVNAIGAVNVIHPFGTASLEQVIADLVRVGELDGQGSFGIKLMEDVPPASPRYTKVMMSKLKEDYYFKLLKYAPECEGEVDIEPEYLITPVPYCLTVGALNLGLGIQGRTPAFTFKSLVAAFLADDPTLLESNFGYKLNKNDSDLQALWETGKGKLSLSMAVQRLSDDEIIISGSGEVFKPDLKAFNEFTKTGSIFIKNESTDKIAIRIEKAKRARVDMNEVFKVAQRVARFKRAYNILVVRKNPEGKNIIQTIGIKEWLGLTINRYIKTYEQYKLDRVAELESEVQVYSLMPEVGKLLLQNKTDDEIIKKVNGLDQIILDKIKRKSLGSLRKEDYTKEVESLVSKINNVKAEDPIKEIEKYY